MKLQATIVISYQARSLADAGATLDDILQRARERADVDVESVEVHTPSPGPAVTLPPIAPSAPAPSRVPHPIPDSTA
jgi:hypothetical protein